MVNEGTSQPGRVTPSDFTAKFLAGIPPDLAASFTPRQLLAVYQAFGPWSGKERRGGWHATVPLPWGSYAVSIRRLGARDHRRDRLDKATWRGVLIGAGSAAIVLLGVLFASRYVMGAPLGAGNTMPRAAGPARLATMPLAMEVREPLRNP